MANYSVIVWNNDGVRREEPASSDLGQAKAIAKQNRTMLNRTVKIGLAGNSIYHWSRSTHLQNNHWVQRATADEWFV